MFRHYYMSLLHESIAKGAGKDIRDGAVVPFERVWMFSVHYLIVLLISTVTFYAGVKICLLYTSPSPRDRTRSRMPSSA